MFTWMDRDVDGKRWEVTISQKEMQRELHAFAMAESCNRGLEKAVQLLLARATRARGTERFDLEHWASAIRALKTDASGYLSDWWADNPSENPLPQPNTESPDPAREKQ